MQRRNGEHWAGLLYMRWISLRVTRLLISSPISANGYTYLMTVAGLASGPALLIPGVTGAILGALLIQVYLLLDCVDGELARWRKQTSITGVYLDRIGAYLSEAAFLVGLGFRSAGHLHADSWTVLGLTAALCVILVKSETDLVDVARARSGLSAVAESAAVPRSAGAAKARTLASALKVHRLIVVIESSLLVLAAGIADAVAGGPSGLFFTRLSVAILAAIALAMVVLHFASVIMSNRLKG